MTCPTRSGRKARLQVPVLAFFLLSIVAQVAVQLKAGYQAAYLNDPTHRGRGLSDTVAADAPWEVMRRDVSSLKQSITSNESKLVSSLSPKANAKVALPPRTSTFVDTSNTSRPTAKTNRPIRIIYGIVSHDLDHFERNRRNLIRRTSLSYFVTPANRSLLSDEDYEEQKHWICSLNDLEQHRLEHPEKCRMAYAFVLGANPNGPTMLLDFNESYPIAVSPPPDNATRADISDCVYLNIQENGKYGKSPTWFRYVIDVLDRHGWHDDFQYVWKSDSDNLLYTPNFFRYVDGKLPKRPSRVFGGRPLTYEKCGGDAHDHCSQMVGPLFMAGGGYFLSIDLARFITDSSAFDHEAVKLPHEDMTTGNFVYSHPKKIKIFKEPRKAGVIRKHPVKSNKKYKFWWQKMLRQERNRLLHKFEANDPRHEPRALVVMSMGEDAAHSKLVERFVWSARHQANFKGWIVLFTDARAGRYDNVESADTFIVIQPKPEHYNFQLQHKERIVGRLKTYVLEYVESEDRLDDIQLVYFLDLDVMFGSDIAPLFKGLEARYAIGGALLSDDDEEGTSSSSQIWFFGNNATNIPEGMTILDRDVSQSCLKRYRYWIDQDLEAENDQMALRRVIDGTEAEVLSKIPPCEVVVMGQDEKFILTPGDEEVSRRADDILDAQKNKTKLRNRYPPLLHIRSTGSQALTGNQHKHEIFLRDVLNINSRRKDRLGISRMSTIRLSENDMKEVKNAAVIPL